MKLIDKVQDIIFEVKTPICDDCITLMGEIKNRQQVNKRCSILYNNNKIVRKKNTCQTCKKIKISNSIIKDHIEIQTISFNLNQNKSSKIEEKVFGEFNISFKFKWVSFIEEEDINYIFPNPINKNMKLLYSKPSIYRWILVNPEGNNLQEVYIGEAQKLSNRIYFYLKPGKTQMTSIRLNKLFTELTSKGYKVSLQKLEFEPFYLGKYEISESSLDNKFVRRFLEHMMASYYTVAGYSMINA